jgi:hypothetical protein
MKTAVVLAGVLVALALAVSAAPAPSPPDATGAAAQMFTRPPTALWHFGYVRSLTKKGSRWELRFDPALWLSGVTANRAAIEDRVIRPGEGVPNDYYVRNDRRRALTFLVPASAKATVLRNRTNIRSTRIPLAELAEIVLGRNPKRRALMDQGNHLGYWISVRLDTVRSLDQQYQP